MKNSSGVYETSVRYDGTKYKATTIKKPVYFEKKHYLREIKYDSATQPIWEKKKRADCNCGDFDCEYCRMAFNFWTNDQLDKIFAGDLTNLCSVRFRIPLIGHNCSTIVEARNNAISLLHSLECDQRKAVGIVDALVDPLCEKINSQACTLHCILITTQFSAEEIRNLQSLASFDSHYYRLELATSLRVEWGDVDPDSNWIMPFDYFAWCLDMKQISLSDDVMRSKGYYAFLPHGKHTERIFFFSVPNIEKKLSIVV